MKYQLLLLLLLFSSQYSFSQEIPDGIYKTEKGYQKATVYKNKNRIVFVSEDKNYGSEIKFSTNKFTLKTPDDPIKIQLDAYLKTEKTSTVSDSILLKVYDSDMSSKIYIMIDSDSSYLFNDSNRPVQVTERLIERNTVLKIRIIKNNQELTAEYVIPDNASEFNLHIKDISKLETQEFTWKYGVTNNEIIIDNAQLFYYIAPFSVKEENISTKGLNKIKPKSIKGPSPISYVEDDIISIEDIAVEALEPDLQIALEVDSVSAVLTDSVASIEEVFELADLEGYENVHSKYIDESNDDSDKSYEEKRTISELLKIAKEQNKLVRIYYNCSFKPDPKKGTYISVFEPINKYYVCQIYSSKDFKEIKKLKVKNTPQIIILSADGEILDSEENPSETFTAKETEKGLLSVYKEYLLKIKDDLDKKISKPNPELSDINNYFKCVNTLLIVQTRAATINFDDFSYTDMQENNDALVYAYDYLSGLPANEDAMNYLMDYFDINNDYSIQGDKLPEAILYLLKYSDMDEKTEKKSKRIMGSILERSQADAQMIGSGIGAAPNRKKDLIDVYLYNASYGYVKDSVNVQTEFIRKYFNDISSFSDSISVKGDSVSNQYAYYLNNFAWDVYLNDLTDQMGDALIWVNKAIEAKERPAFFDTKAHILYRLGRREEAIEVQGKALKKQEEEENQNKPVIYEMKLNLELMKLGIL